MNEGKKTLRMCQHTIIEEESSNLVK